MLIDEGSWGELLFHEATEGDEAAGAELCHQGFLEGDALVPAKDRVSKGSPHETETIVR